MGKTIEKFAFRIWKMGKKEKLPFNPIVTITLDNWSTSEKEDDLDAVGKRAKAELRKAKDEARLYKASPVE